MGISVVKWIYKVKIDIIFVQRNPCTIDEMRISEVIKEKYIPVKYLSEWIEKRS